MPEPMWSPSPERVAQANLTRFIDEVRRDHPGVVDFAALYRWSVERADEFWPRAWRFCEVQASRSWDAVCEPADGPTPLSRTWFRGARLNFADNLLRYRDERPALISWTEQGRGTTLSYSELGDRVARVAGGLRRCGVTVGDRVAGLLPNVPEAVIAMLAAASIGAVWSSTSPDFGLQGVLDRFGQIEPKVLFAADGYRYNGKPIDIRDRVAQIVARIPSIERVVFVSETRDAKVPAGVRGATRLDDLVKSEADWSREQLPFDHPLYILYSSGTTGVPKCIVHGVGGTLLQHLKELVLHTDMKRTDRIFYFTTCGWMMWNWLVSALAVGATVVLYDGSPLYPNADALWDMAEQERVTVFGTSARYLSSLSKAGCRPARTHDLSSLRTILSTGSPLAGASFDYVYGHIKRDVCLSSISGGTDIVSCFALGNPIAPVYRGELQTRGLGMDVQVFDANGRPLVGEPGELVCAAPFPSMPIRIWNDADGRKYRAAYFEHFPGIWRHGDWVELTGRGGMVIYGRSDATLNPSGVRIGTAEIYRQVETIEEVLESVVVGQDWEGDQRIVLFVRMRPERELDETLRDRIRARIREHTTPRHVPRLIIPVADIPRTISGKTVELAVRDMIHGRPVKNREALANPESLEIFRDLPELRANAS